MPRVDSQTFAASDKRRIEAAFRALNAYRDERAFMDLVEELTAYLASRRKVLAPVVARELDCATSADFDRAGSRMRLLLLRLGASYKLGASRFDATIADLRVVATEYISIEERVVPSLALMLSDNQHEALEDALRNERSAVAAAFRAMIAKKAAAAAQAPAA
jgi:hypothetical protein